MLTRNIGSDQQTGTPMAMVDLMERNRKLEMSRTDELESFKAEMSDTISVIKQVQGMRPLTKSKAHSAEYEDRMSTVVEGLSTALLDWPQRAQMFTREQAIVDSLQFEGMLHRHKAIVNAHSSTFKWVHKRNLHFKQWLETGDGLYWITGDPGSGKSTLVKYLYDDTETHEALTKWAEPKSLIKASFYFWFSGTRLQKSQEGLLRSLLFELLRQCPGSIQTACQTRWDTATNAPWAVEELLQTLKSLRLHSPSTRFCLFIDGLDEYQSGSRAPGQGSAPSDATRVIDVMRTLASLPDVKLCVSSRSWPAFEEAFGQLEGRKFSVNDQNRDDIRSYIRDRFGKSNASARWASDPQKLSILVDELANDSKGVFLWVFLAVESLLRSLRNDDGVADLRQRLEQTPKTLNSMFEKMLESVDATYHEQASQILQVALHTTEPWNIFPYLFIGDDGYDAINTAIKPWTQDECALAVDATVERIKVRCPDLIRVWVPDGKPSSAQSLMLYRVDFLHRTVGDFLALEDTQRSLEQRLKTPFRPLEFICNTLLIQMKVSLPHHKIQGFWKWEVSLLESLLHFVRERELEMDVSQEPLLDELERVLATHAGKDDFIIDGDSFAGILIQKDLFRYVESRLPHALKDNGRPLLECALLPKSTWKYPSTVPSPRMASLLLSHNSNPRQSSASKPSKSIWEMYMTTSYDRYKKGAGHQTPSQQQNEILIVQELLRYKADTYIKHVIKWSEPKPTVGKANGIRYPTYIDLSDMIKTMYSQDERRCIEALIRDQRAGNVSGWMKWR